MATLSIAAFACNTIIHTINACYSGPGLNCFNLFLYNISDYEIIIIKIIAIIIIIVIIIMCIK